VITIATAAAFLPVLQAHLFENGHGPVRVGVSLFDGPKGNLHHPDHPHGIWLLAARCRECGQTFEVMLEAHDEHEVAVSFHAPALQAHCPGGE
jgi:hypothetical protein